MTQLTNRRVLITGAAHGMGRLMAERLSAEGARLVLADIDEAAIGELASSLGSATAHRCDVRSRESIAEMRDAVRGVDILINNAGVISTGAYLDISGEADERMLAVNVDGVHWMSKAFLPDLIESEGGHLVMMSSIASIVGVPYQALYSATKWFVAGLGESIRQELHVEGHRHVHVTIVHPSVVATDFYSEGTRAPHLLPILQPDRVVDRIIEGIKRNRRYVREPLLVKTAPLLRGLLPSRAADAVSRLLGTHRVVPREPR